MSDPRNVSIIQPDTTIEGKIENGGLVEVFGVVEGLISAQQVEVREGGRIVGTLRATTANVLGHVKGDVKVESLFSIASSGVVAGDVEYGQLAVEPGGDLSADVRNVPPELVGDFELEVQRGRAVAISSEDLKALDPDNTSDELIFNVTNMAHGRIAKRDTPMQAIQRFTQADLASGGVLFVHDGADQSRAGFDVVVTDAAGATSGRPQRVQVSVHG